ncbi:MAG TPA: twin-arginine translocase subunit TatC [Pseudonocardia sp.]|nr:twin-arginine translocase subunit TatC [Pseudonocardia sp.]
MWNPIARRRRRQQNPDGTMTLIEHLYELRTRLAVALVAIAVMSVVGYIWFAVPFFGWYSLGDLLKSPYCELPAKVRPMLNAAGGCTLYGNGAFDQFSLRMRVGIAAGFVLSSPVWFYQLWSFIMPGLYRKERKFALIFVTCAATLFLAGAAMAYYVISEALGFLLTISADVQTTLLSGESYFGLLIALLLIFGVSFELPLLVVMLNKVGLVSYERLRRWRRGLIFGLFVFAAVVTPGGDPISMTALALTLTVLFEISIQISRINDRAKARRRLEEGWETEDPDAPSSLDTSLGEVEEPEPVAPPEPVRGPGSYDDVT